MEQPLPRALALLHTHFIYTTKLFFPFFQSYDYGYACLHHPTTLGDVANLGTLLTYVVVSLLVGLILKERKQALVWPTAILVVS